MRGWSDPSPLQMSPRPNQPFQASHKVGICIPRSPDADKLYNSKSFIGGAHMYAKRGAHLPNFILNRLRLSFD